MKKKVTQMVNHRKANKEKKDSNALDIMIDADDLYTSDEQVSSAFVVFFMAGLCTKGVTTSDCAL